MEDIRNLKEAGSAQKIMTRGAIKITKELYIQGKFSGVISAGGGVGTALGAAVMRELPFGLPKVIVSTQKLVQAGIKGYVGNKDVVVMPCVVDIAGLNRFLKKTLGQAAGAITGMVEFTEPDVPERPMILMTMNGAVTGCGLKVKSLLEDKGYEMVVFHTIGIGGMTFEDFIMEYPVQGVIDLALNEIGNELLGGMASAGPHRLEAAGKKGIPQVVVPGTVDLINFLAPETVPEK